MTDTEIVDVVRDGLSGLCDVVRPYCGVGYPDPVSLIVLASDSQQKNVEGKSPTVAVFFLRREIEGVGFAVLLAQRVENARQCFVKGSTDGSAT